MKKDNKNPDKASKSKKSKKVIIREFVNVKHVFTQEERNVLTERLTSALQASSELDDQLKSVSSNFKVKIKTHDCVVAEAKNLLVSNYEMRQVEAEVHLDRKKGVKTLHFFAPGKPEHHKKIREEAMSDSDYQRLPLPDAPPEKPKEEKLTKKQIKAKAVVDAALAQERGEEAAAAAEDAEKRDMPETAV